MLARKVGEILLLQVDGKKLLTQPFMHDPLTGSHDPWKQNSLQNWIHPTPNLPRSQSEGGINRAQLITAVDLELGLKPAQFMTWERNLILEVQITYR